MIVLVGLLAGITWALETVIIGVALSMTPFVSRGEAILFAPFVSTFLHDFASATYLWVLSLCKKTFRNVISVFRTKDFKWLVLASAIGGPVGMTGYVLTVNYMGASIGAVASAIYPAIGSVLAYLFLKERIRFYQWIFLLLTLCGVYGLSYSPEISVDNFWLGLCGVFMCAFGWGIEGVILSRCLKNPCIKSEYALQIRQTVSALIYGIVIIPSIKAVDFTIELISLENAEVILIIGLAAFFATISYLFYYKAIASVGVSKAMGLNITYTAWAMVLSVIIFKDSGILNPLSICCSLIVVICGILAATDYKDLFKKKNN